MEAAQAVGALAALAHETRLAVFRRLVACGPDGLAAGALAQALALPPSSLTFHLHALAEAGLVQATRQGRQVIYAARYFALRGLLAFLTETCCLNRPELCGDILALLPPMTEENPAMSPAFNVLFLCVHNSARSIMAEAILRDVAPERFRAYSAGSDPAVGPVPEVLQKLATLGHDVGGLASKSWAVFQGPEAPRMDFVIALCDVLEGQTCPDFGATAVTASWPLPDPGKFQGSAAERQTLLNELYASLHRRIAIFASLPFVSLDRMAVQARLDELGAGPVGVLARMGDR